MRKKEHTLFEFVMTSLIFRIIRCQCLSDNYRVDRQRLGGECVSKCIEMKGKNGRYHRHFIGF